MPFGEVVIATGKTVGALGSLAKASPGVMRFVRRAVHRVTNGYAVIPIFGSGGVGKSTAARIIAGELPDAAHRPYEESLWTEVVRLKGDIPGELRVAPGQKTRVDRHWPELFKSLSAGKALGLINIVSYGYHSFEIDSIQDSISYRQGMSNADFLEAYASDRRDIELELLEEVMSGLSATTSRIWLATIINKQDLWRHNEQDVLKHYRDGAYSKIIDKVASRLGSRSFQHEYIPVSLAISNLTSPSGEIIAPVVGGYDVYARDKSLKELSSKLNLLVSQ